MIFLSFQQPAVSLAGGQGVAIDPVRILVALGIALFAAWIAALFLARLRRGKGLVFRIPGEGREAALTVRETRRIGAAAEVSLVEWGKRQYLIGVTAGSVNVLDSCVLPEEGAGKQAATAGEPTDAAK